MAMIKSSGFWVFIVCSVILVSTGVKFVEVGNQSKANGRQITEAFNERYAQVLADNGIKAIALSGNFDTYLPRERVDVVSVYSPSGFTKLDKVALYRVSIDEILKGVEVERGAKAPLVLDTHFFKNVSVEFSDGYWFVGVSQRLVDGGRLSQAEAQGILMSIMDRYVAYLNEEYSQQRRLSDVRRESWI